MMRALQTLLVALLWAVSLPIWAQTYDRYGHALILDSQQGWLYVDRDGHPLIRPYIFDNGPDYYVEGLARFVESGKMGFHDKALNIVIPAKYDFVFPFENGKAKAGTHCQIHRKGEHTFVTCDQWETVSKPDE